MSVPGRLRGAKRAAPDSQIRQDMNQVSEALHETQWRYRKPDQIANNNTGAGSPGDIPSGNMFPARLTAYDPRDTMMEAEMEADKDTFGQKFLTNEKLQWLMDKKKNVEYAQFMEWAETFFDPNDPAEQRIIEEIMPEWYLVF